ncbi:hypothetical protein LIV57_05705 [Chryseobacterium sp. X308]|uniref:hypothetical protein n=1 Tax=Chryseobacterium sp. X308 TaxID=2884873 RepID=UPI001D136B52|nr:hypothetical protein [Chryseobacterium sp. X308]MCC3214757.1 hypothetical protein [Chryseobacterium sp. X308]
MKKLILLMAVLICLSCNRKGVTLSFCDVIYPTNKKSCLVYNNETDIKYIFYPPSFISSEEWGYLGGNIWITDKEGKEPPNNDIFIDKAQPTGKAMDQYIINEHKDSLLWKRLLAQGLRVDYWGAKKYKVITKSKFVLGPGDEKEISEKISIFKKDLETSGSYYSFDKKKEYFIQIGLNFDSTEIKKHLTHYELDSLKRNNIKIFHGKLKTEKIPLKFH